jgi:hypothetical protein
LDGAAIAVLLVHLPPLVAIPLHGVIQLVSNGSRVLVQRRHARLDWIAWYALPLIPAGLVGLRIAQALPERLVEGAIGAVVLLATWLPRQDRAGEPSVLRPRLRFLALGSFSGFLSVVLGAVGPIIDPFFLGLGLSRQALVGTKAACQTLSHPSRWGSSVRRLRLRRHARCSLSARCARSPAASSAAACSTGSASRASLALPQRAHGAGAAAGLEGAGCP